MGAVLVQPQIETRHSAADEARHTKLCRVRDKVFPLVEQAIEPCRTRPRVCQASLGVSFEIFVTGQHP